MQPDKTCTGYIFTFKDVLYVLNLDSFLVQNNTSFFDAKNV